MIDRINLVQWRLCHQAAIHMEFAARIEATPAVYRTAHFLFRRQVDLALPLHVGVRDRHRLDEQLHVRVLRFVDHLDRIALFSDGALIQNVDLVTDLVGSAQVMRDVQELSLIHI